MTITTTGGLTLEIAHGGVYINVPRVFEAFWDYSGRGLSAFDPHWRGSATN